MSERSYWLQKTKPIFESSALTALTAIIGTIWVFFELADEVIEGETHAVDRAVLMIFRVPDELANPIGPVWIEELARDFTALGGIGVLTLLTIATTGFLYLQGKPRVAALVVAAVSSGLLASMLFKFGIDRPRPDLISRQVDFYTSSFPSGHSTMAAVTYLTIATRLALIQTRRMVRFYLFGVALLIVALVGISRVYLGVHWPSDVIGGWTLGTAWALLFWLIGHLLSRQGKL